MKTAHVIWLAVILLTAGTQPAGAVTHYVDLNGQHIPPYTNWHGVARDIQSACDVAADGDLVLVSNATYFVSSPITITNGITVRGLNGSRYTYIDGLSTTRCVQVFNSNALVEGFTITHGATNSGCGVFLRRGRSLLESVTEYGSDGTTAMPPAQFFYQDDDAPTYTVAGNTASSIRWPPPACPWNS